MEASQTRYQFGKENFFGESTHGGYYGWNWLATTNSENWERGYTVNSPYRNSFSLYSDPSYNLLPQESSVHENEFGSFARACPNFEFSVNYHLHVNRPGVNSSKVPLKHQDVSRTCTRNHHVSTNALEELCTQKCVAGSLRKSPESVISVCPSNFYDHEHQMISNSYRFSPLSETSQLTSINSSYSSQQQVSSHNQHQFYDEAIKFVKHCHRSKKVGTRREHYRKVYTKEQNHLLEEAYKLNAFLKDQKHKKELSVKTGLQPRQVQVWFQNRRSKEKRERERVTN